MRRARATTTARGAWAAKLGENEIVEAGAHQIFVIHDLSALDVDLAAGGFAAVIAGHSHRPRNQVVDGILYFNPGSAGPRRFMLPITIGRMEVGAKIVATIIELA